AGLVVSGGSSLTVSDNYLQSGGGIILGGRTLTVGGLLNLEGGSLRGSGTGQGNEWNNAEGRPGTAPATGAMTTDDHSGPRRDGGTAGADYDQLVVNGFATLSGTLQITLVNGYQPQAGDQFQPLLFAQGRGTFARYAGDVSGFSLLYVYDDGGFWPPGLTLVAN